MTIEQGQDSGVFDLFNPEYNPEANTLKYIIAENATTTTKAINLPDEFGQSTLVIGESDDHRVLSVKLPGIREEDLRMCIRVRGFLKSSEAVTS